MARTMGQQRKQAFLLNVRQATISENKLVTATHLCVTEQKSLERPSFEESSMTKCSSLPIPDHNLHVELVVIGIFTDVHVKVICTFMCVKTALSLRCSRRLNMLVNMSTAETAGLLCCPRLAVLGRDTETLVMGSCNFFIFFLPLYCLYIVPRR